MFYFSGDTSNEGASSNDAIDTLKKNQLLQPFNQNAASFPFIPVEGIIPTVDENSGTVRVAVVKTTGNN